MKTNVPFLSPLLWTMLSFVFAIQGLNAQIPAIVTEQNDAAKFTGSVFKVEDVVVKSDAIFVGTVMELGDEEQNVPAEAPYAGPLYHGVKINVLQLLRGTVGAQTSVTLFIAFVAHEKLHAVGSSYIFFVKKNAQGAPDQFTVLKLLPATPDNIAKVKALIATAPASK